MSRLPDLFYVPLEIGEDVIDQLSRDVNTLRSCALTCRGWHPRARYHLLTSIRLRSKEDLQSFCDYIVSNPRMSCCVRKLSMSVPVPDKTPPYFLEVLPVTLVIRLPNLQSYSISDSEPRPGARAISFHPTTLAQIKAYLLVEELKLGSLEFGTSAELARLLIALPRLRRLECKAVDIRRTAADTARFRDKCSSLSELTVGRQQDVRTINLIIQMSLSTLNVLRYETLEFGSYANRALELSESKHLHSLEFPLFNEQRRILQPPIIPNTLRNLTITSPTTYPKDWDKVDNSLDDVIPQARGTPRVTVSIPRAKRNRLAFWSDIVHRRFPRLHQRDLLQVRCSSDEEVHFGHDEAVSAMAASMDGRYIATVATDGTVIIWSGTTATEKVLMQTQCPQSSTHVLSLHFSDTGEFLAGMCKHDLIIWRVVDGGHIAAVACPGTIGTYAWRRQSLEKFTFSVLQHGSPGPICSLSVTAVQVHDSGAVTTIEHVPLSAIGDPAFCRGELSSYHGWNTQSSSGLCVAAYGSHASACLIWRMLASIPAYITHQLEVRYPHSPSCACFVGDTQFVAGFKDGTLRWWDISGCPGGLLATADSKPCGVLSLPTFGAEVRGLSVSPLHAFLVATCKYNPVVCVLRTGMSTRTAQGHLNDDCLPLSLHLVLRGHKDPVLAACFSPCERYVATASRDTTVRVWSIRDGELLWTFRNHHYAVEHVVFSPDGRILASADEGGRVCTHVFARFVRDAPPTPPRTTPARRTRDS